MKIDITFKDATPEEVKTLLRAIGRDTKQLELPLQSEDEDIPMDADSGITVDKNGLPWDERIHSSNRAFTNTGEWRRKRGVSGILVEQVEAELRAGLQNQEAATNELPPAPQVAATAPVELPPAPQVAPIAPAPQIDKSFSGLMNTISGLMAQGAIDPAYMNSIPQRITTAFNTQVNTVVDIMGNQQMIDYAFDLLRVDGKIA